MNNEQQTFEQWQQSERNEWSHQDFYQQKRKEIKKIVENIQTLAMEDMTEDGIHHDDFPDKQWEYEQSILKEITNMLE